MWENHSDKTNKLILKAPHWWHYSDIQKYVQFRAKTRATTAATSVPWKKDYWLQRISLLPFEISRVKQTANTADRDYETSAGSPTPAPRHFNNHTCTTNGSGTPVAFLPCKIDLFDIVSANKYDVTLQELLVNRKISSIWQSNRFNKTIISPKSQLHQVIRNT